MSKTIVRTITTTVVHYTELEDSATGVNLIEGVREFAGIVSKEKAEKMLRREGIMCKVTSVEREEVYRAMELDTFIANSEVVCDKDGNPVPVTHKEQ